jgi:hypothetical protein
VFFMLIVIPRWLPLQDIVFTLLTAVSIILMTFPRLSSFKTFQTDSTTIIWIN